MYLREKSRNLSGNLRFLLLTEPHCAAAYAGPGLEQLDDGVGSRMGQKHKNKLKLSLSVQLELGTS